MMSAHVSKQQREKWLAELLDGTQYATEFRELVSVTRYAVDADHDTKHEIWERYQRRYGVPWRDHGVGLSRKIGEIDLRGITWQLTVLVWFAQIGPVWVAFIGSEAMVVDHGLIAAWRETVFPGTTIHGHHSNAPNFGNVVHQIEDDFHVKLIDEARARRHDEFMQILERGDK